mmetsp:Transcript_89612/g.248887  ORF Transcript_89612/g.248887 Transcript_89612/m.248887 type:complete len:246 (-) Transcript_89612:132-869(-)
MERLCLQAWHHHAVPLCSTKRCAEAGSSLAEGRSKCGAAVEQPPCAGVNCSREAPQCGRLPGRLAHRCSSEPKPPSVGTTASKDKRAPLRDGTNQLSGPKWLPERRDGRLLAAPLGSLLVELLEACGVRGPSAEELVAPKSHCRGHLAELLLPAEQREPSDAWIALVAGPASVSHATHLSFRLRAPPPRRQTLRLRWCQGFRRSAPALAELQEHSDSYMAPPAGFAPGSHAASRTFRSRVVLAKW